MSRRHQLASAASLLVLLLSATARADSVAVTAPNIINVAGATSVTLNGSTFVNQGLVGTARLPADLHDFNGETLGSFSGMAIDLATWRRGASGYTATMYTLPDRGPNGVGGLTTTNYAARLNRFSLVLNPYDGAASVPASTQQMTLTQSGGFLLRDATGQLFTGRDPQSGVLVRDGISYPTPPAGDPGAGKIAMDAEAVTFLTDGSFYVGDEYGAAIYYFDKTGKQIGAIQANPDILPRVNGAVNFNGTNDSPLVPGTTGRRSNQGMEGVSVSPDGKRLFAVLQSATLQDNPTNVAVRRNNTRVLVYDISTNKTPTAPMAEYVLQLPVFNNSATGTGNATTTAAQSEVLALNNTQFLVLSRDGNGRGTNGNGNAIAFKSVLLVDTAGATNIAGTAFSGTTPISTSAAANGSGALVGGVTPVQQVELVNMLNTAQLSKFGLNTNTRPSVQYTLSEKWEAMGLVPVLEEGKPQDFFLLIGNDNDFVSHDVDAAGIIDANTALTSTTAGVGDNDNVVLVYRLTLPTYIDPQALAYLQGAAPYAMAASRVVGAQMVAAPAVAGQQNLSLLRRARYAGAEVAGRRAWTQGAFERVATPGQVGPVDAGSFALGVDWGGDTLRYGVTVAGSDYQGDGEGGFDIDGHSYAAGVYGGVFAASGLYAQGALSYGKLRMNVRRPASYGLEAKGRVTGEAISTDLQAGWSAAFGAMRVGPFVEVAYTDLKLDSYVEHGAAVGNGAIPGDRYRRIESSIGLEADFAAIGGVRPSLRIAYTGVDEGGDDSLILALAAVPGSADRVALPSSDENYAEAELALEGDWSGFGWRASIGARNTDNDVSGRLTLGVAKAF